jgi:Rps23 Pro-64 3,4-dihydroxylase Tpa1-like proline 4-hydroxylase
LAAARKWRKLHVTDCAGLKYMAEDSNLASQPVSAPYLVVDNFMPLDVAEAMRADIDSHFTSPHLHRAETHQVWNYWFVPGLYTYLRTRPDKVIRPERVEQFTGLLRQWSIATLGLGTMTMPHLSLYVSGCRQNLHNDAKNGCFAFVYSLTRNARRTGGGETIILNQGDLFRNHMTAAGAGRAFFSLIEPSFNRLIVFDDRLPHAVERVEGSLDPVEGRLVLHGHLRESGTIVDGALNESQIRPAVMQALESFSEKRLAHLGLYHGPCVLRMKISESGVVLSCRPLLDRVMAADGGDVGWPNIRSQLMRSFMALKFPQAPGTTTITQPVRFGEPRRE